MYNILVVDSIENKRKFIGYLLSENYKIFYAQNCSEALNIVNSNNIIHCIILDLALPQMEGFKFLNRLKQTKFKNYIPVIILTSISREENEKNALILGACDYIEEPFDADVLKIKIRNAINKNDINHQEIKYLDAFDTLTNIYNRKYFFEVTKRMLSLFPNETFVFIRLDINKFKFVNNIFGSKKGDMILCDIAACLTKYLNPLIHCTYGRIESDKFGICFSYNKENYEEIFEICDNIRKEIENIKIGFNLIPCFGVCFIDDNLTPMTTILDRASLGALSIKNTYGRLYGTYSKEMDKKLLENQEIENRMRTALANKEFKVNLQPKYDLRTGKLIGSEALVRWQHPTRGMLYPDGFISIFENNGFIINLDIYVFEEVCRFLRNWMDNGYNILPVSVNFSRIDIYNTKLIYKLMSIRNKYNIPPQYLHLEITETVYTKNPVKVIETLDILREQGFKIEMDDFGKGYSSLSMLSELPVDVLKLDMRFLQSKMKNEKKSHILDYVVKLAKSLDLSVVAEGIETVEDLEFLKRIGCEYGQGFYFARPMSEENFRFNILK